MSTKSPDPFAPFIGPGAEAFKLWISFFPTAPLFGVEWRFKDAVPFPPMMQGLGAFDATAKARAKSAPKKAANGKAEAPKKAAAAKPAPAPAAPKPAPQPAPKAEAAPRPAPKAEPAPVPKPAPEAEAAPKAAPKVETAPEPKPAPAVAKAEAPAEPSAGSKPKGLMDKSPANPDDLKMIRGIGPGLESKLNALGIYKFDQIAAFSEADLVWVDENLTAFKGRCFRDDWVGQARALRG